MKGGFGSCKWPESTTAYRVILSQIWLSSSGKAWIVNSRIPAMAPPIAWIVFIWPFICVHDWVICQQWAAVWIVTELSGQGKAVRCSDGSQSPPQPLIHPATSTQSRKPRSQVWGQPSLLVLLRSLQPWQDSQFSPFIYTPLPQLNVTSKRHGPAVAADPRVGAVSTDPSLSCWGTRPRSCNTQCNCSSMWSHHTYFPQETKKLGISGFVMMS